MNAPRTSAERLKALTASAEALGLKPAVREMCAEFGKVTSIDILTLVEAQKPRALCFLRLESEAQEMELMRTLGLTRFGGEVLVVVDL
jgi:RNA recognition motif-containing protein